MNMDKSSFITDKYPIIDKSPIYRVFRRRSSQNSEECINYYAIAFDFKNLTTYGLQEIFRLNKEAFFKAASQMPYTRHLLGIMRYLRKDSIKFIEVEAYNELKNLQQFLCSQQLPITEQKAINIFLQVIQAVFCMHSTGYMCHNVRPEHFVSAKDNLWKLKCLVLCKEPEKYLVSQYTWRKDYQPPEAYTKKLAQMTKKDHEKMIVWNLGSILLDLLNEKHALNSLQEIQFFQKSQFDFKKIGIHKMISQNTQQFISKTLVSDANSRISLSKLWELPLVKIRIQSVKLKMQQFQLQKATIQGQNLSKEKEFISLLNNFEDTQKQSIIIQEGQSFVQILSGIIEKKKYNIMHEEQLVLSQQSSFISSPYLKKKSLSFNFNELNKPNVQSLPQYLPIFLKKYESECNIAKFLTRASNRVGKTLLRSHNMAQAFLCCYALSFMGLVLLNTIEKSLSLFQNIYGFDSELWFVFSNTGSYSAVRNFVQQILKQCAKRFQMFLQKCSNIQECKKVTEGPIIKDLLADYHVTTYQAIKDTYRKVNYVNIKQIIIATLELLNKNAKQNIRDMTSLGYCLIFNKHKQGEQQQDFLSHMRLCEELADCTTFSLKDYEKFLNIAPPNLVNANFRALQRKYYQQ